MNTPIITNELEKSMSETQAKTRCSVIPIIKGDKISALPWKEYRERWATKSEIKEWAQKFEAYAVIMASPMGEEEDMMVIDIDQVNDVEGCPEENLPDIFKDDFVVRTGKGFHIYKKIPVGMPIYNGVKYKMKLPGSDDLFIVDLRGNKNKNGESGGGYVLGPGSKHPSGRMYEIHYDNPIQELDEKFFKKHFTEMALSGGVKKSDAIEKLWIKGADDGCRTDTCVRLSGTILGLLPEYMWHDVGFYLLERWNTRNNPPMEREELWSTFTNIARSEKRQRKF